MATVADRFSSQEPRQDVLSGTPRAHAIDRWIFVFMAAWFIAITLTGFIPDALMKVGMVQAGLRPPFPLVMHFHAVLMGSFLLLVLAQTSLMATGRSEYHMRLGIAAFILAPALVVVGFILAPTMYYETWNALQAAPAAERGKLQDLLSIKENILLLQIRVGILFSLLLVIGLWARGADAGLHKRMMILAPAMALPAGIDRITWLPTTIPAAPLAIDFYVMLAVSPMLLWDLIRNRSVHRAYWIWLAAFVPAAVFVNALWDTPWWHATARHIMRV
ncbi:MAG: hypothetical protein ABI853_03345 [Sphingomicrobium sp.]